MVKRRPKIGKYHYKFKGSIFKASVAKGILPSGRTINLERIESPNTVCVIPILDSKKILMIREYRMKSGLIEWRLPTGIIDKGYTPRQAANKELQEEVGFRAKKLTLIWHQKYRDGYNYDSYGFVGQNLVPSKLTNDEEEEIYLAPVTLARANKLAYDGTVKANNSARAIIKFYHARKKFGF